MVRRGWMWRQLIWRAIWPLKVHLPTRPQDWTCHYRLASATTIRLAEHVSAKMFYRLTNTPIRIRNHLAHRCLWRELRSSQ